MADVPEGFAPHFRTSPVTAPWEPLFSRWTPEGLTLGFAAAPPHCNARGLLHGGVIAALADNAMGLSYARAVEGAAVVTVSLALDYLDSAKAGDWVEIRCRLLKAGRSMGFVEALALAGARPIARASATFRNLGDTP